MDAFGFLIGSGKYPLDKKDFFSTNKGLLFIYRMWRFPFDNIEHYIILYRLAKRKQPTRC